MGMCRRSERTQQRSTGGSTGVTSGLARYGRSVQERGGRDHLPSLEAVAAYIDLNPVRAGLVEDPKDYRFLRYAAAWRGMPWQGLDEFPGKMNEASRAAYRIRLFVGGGTAHQSAVVQDKER